MMCYLSADFLLEGEGKWWSKDEEAIELHDVTSLPPQKHTPPLHHFRSSSLCSEVDYLKKCWRLCINEKIKIPIDVLRLDQSDGSTTVIHSGFLSQEDSESQAKPENVENEIDISQDHDSSSCINLPQGNEDLTEYPEAFHEDIVEIRPAPDEIIELAEQEEPEFVPVQPDSTLNNEKNAPMNIEEPQLKSRLAKAISVVLGNTDEVMFFDKKYTQLKEVLKSNPKNLSINQLESNYKNMLAQIQTKILAKGRSVKKELKNWEKNYLLKHNCSSATYDVLKKDQKASILLKKLKYTKALLKEWKICFL